MRNIAGERASLADLLEVRNFKNKREIFLKFMPPKSRPRTWDRPGLEKLVNEGKDALVAINPRTGLAWPTYGWECGYGYGINYWMPYNLSTHGPWVKWPREGKIMSSNREDMITAAARMRGWLKTIADQPKEHWTLFRLIGKNVACTGQGSPYTRLNLWTLIQRFKSPGQCNNWLGKVIRRADWILRGFGYRASWAALANAAQFSDKRIGKAAVATAAETIRLIVNRHLNEQMPAFSQHRDCVAFLARMRGIKGVLSVYWAARNGLAGQPMAIKVGMALEASRPNYPIRDAYADLASTDIVMDHYDLYNAVVLPPAVIGGKTFARREGWRVCNLLGEQVTVVTSGIGMRHYSFQYDVRGLLTQDVSARCLEMFRSAVDQTRWRQLHARQRRAGVIPLRQGVELELYNAAMSGNRAARMMLHDYLIDANRSQEAACWK